MERAPEVKQEKWLYLEQEQLDALESPETTHVIIYRRPEPRIFRIVKNQENPEDLLPKGAEPSQFSELEPKPEVMTKEDFKKEFSVGKAHELIR